MDKTRIEWAQSTWNPVTGCRHGCEYCYARGIANRFSCETLDAPAELQRIWIEDSKGMPGMHVLRYPAYGRTHDGKEKKEPYPFGFAPTFHKYKLDEYQNKKGRTIFVCSMADLFGEWVPDGWIEEVFAACERAPQHRYLFLTKNPARFCKLANKGKLRAGDNYWYGSTVTRAGAQFFSGGVRYNTFLSIEPLHAPLNAGIGSFGGARLLIIGAETGRRKDKVVPQKEWIDNICEVASLTHAAVFMKDSLTPVMGEENMRRELPWNERLPEG